MGTFKQGIDYFPFEIGLLRDRKLRKPKLKFGYVVNDIYLSLLELIYRDKGYYLVYNEKTKGDIIWEILENLQGRFQPDVGTVEQVVEELVECELFSGDHFNTEILTSKRIQQVYYSATVERQTVDVDFGIWLLSESEMRKLSQKSSILRKFLNRPIDGVNRPNEALNRTSEQQSKVKKSKVNNMASYDGVDDDAIEIPRLEDVQAYCQERKNNIDPQRFYDYYTAIGWKLGDTPIRDWRAVLRRWESNGLDTKADAPKGIVYEKYSKEYLDSLFNKATEERQ